MMVYYNYFGPDYYYPLQSQNGPGQGDKETFSAAAVAVNSPFYGVKTPCQPLGIMSMDNIYSLELAKQIPCKIISMTLLIQTTYNPNTNEMRRRTKLEPFSCIQCLRKRNSIR